MNKSILLVMILILISGVSAYSYIFQQSSDVDLRISCFDVDEFPCNNTVSCHITVFEPDSGVLIDNGTMTYNPTYYNYSLNTTQTSVTGEYSAIVYCTIEDYTSFTYKITPNGEELTEGNSNLYIALFVLLILLFGLGMYGTFNTKNVTAKYSFLGLSYLLLIGITFVGWNIADNFLTSSAGLSNVLFMVFRILMIMALPFFLGSLIFYLFEFRKLKQIKSMIEKGVPEDEAMARVMKGW